MKDMATEYTRQIDVDNVRHLPLKCFVAIPSERFLNQYELELIRAKDSFRCHAFRANCGELFSPKGYYNN